MAKSRQYDLFEGDGEVIEPETWRRKAPERGEEAETARDAADRGEKTGSRRRAAPWEEDEPVRPVRRSASRNTDEEFSGQPVRRTVRGNGEETESFRTERPSVRRNGDDESTPAHTERASARRYGDDEAAPARMERASSRREEDEDYFDPSERKIPGRSERVSGSLRGRHREETELPEHRDRESLSGEEQSPAPHRYFARNEQDDGLGVPSTLFDDFDRFNDPLLREPPKPRKKKKKTKHKAAWGASIVISLLGILAAAYLTVPQLTGSLYRFLPTPAFANGNLLFYDAERAESFHACIRESYHDRIYPGVYLDGMHVGDMTRAEAEEKLSRKEDAAADFDITVTVGNQSWHVTPERVPVTRNTDEVTEKAWALGRGNTAALRGSGKTPFQERIDLASDLRSAPVSLETVRTWDHAALRTLCEGISNYVNRDPVNSAVATFDFGTQTFTFTDDRPGAYLDPEQIYTKVAALLDTEDWHGSLFLTPEKRLADVTKTELMNGFGKISTYTTNTTSNKNRNTNIQLSAEAINGRTVLPGEIFSFNGATGERTAAKGYREAAAIAGGQSKDEIGGGVCQTSSTLFNAVARANLEIVERSPHAWPSSYVEKGFDATVNWPGLDFKFKNNTDWPVFIIAGYAKQKVTVSIYGMRLGVDTVIDLESITTKTIPQPQGTNYVINTSLAVGESKKTVTGRKGYVVETWKVWTQAGKEIKRELLFTSTYKAYQETIEYNPQ